MSVQRSCSRIESHAAKSGSVFITGACHIIGSMVSLWQFMVGKDKRKGEEYLQLRHTVALVTRVLPASLRVGIAVKVPDRLCRNHSHAVVSRRIH